MIQALQEQLSDLPSFIHCLALLAMIDDYERLQGEDKYLARGVALALALAAFERPPRARRLCFASLRFASLTTLHTPAPPPPDDVADLYVYYALIGMGSTSPHLRAAGISILAALVEAAPALVVEHLPRLVELRDDPWWQVQSANVQVTSGVLWHLREYVPAPGKAPPTAPAAARAAAAIANAETVMIAAMGGGHGASAPVTRVFVGYAARLLSFYPSLRPLYVQAVLALPTEARERLLGVSEVGEFIAPESDVLPLLGAMGQRVAVPSAAGVLPAAAVVDAVCEAVLTADLQHLETAHFQLLLAAVVSSELEPITGHLPGAFVRLANTLRDHFFVGLCNAQCCPAAIALLTLLVARLPAGGGGGTDLLSASTLQGSLMLLHAPPTGAPEPSLQIAVAGFLRGAAMLSDTASDAVRELITVWSVRYPALYAASPLRQMNEELFITQVSESPPPPVE